MRIQDLLVDIEKTIELADKLGVFILGVKAIGFGTYQIRMIRNRTAKRTAFFGIGKLLFGTLSVLFQKHNGISGGDIRCREQKFLIFFIELYVVVDDLRL